MKHLRWIPGHRWLGEKLADEQGSVLVVSLLILVVLALLGSVAANLSVTELQSAGSEKRYNQSFYLADGGWQEAPNFLDDAGGDAPTVDPACTGDYAGAVRCGETDIDGITYEYGIFEIANPRHIVRAGGGMEGYSVYQYRVVATADGRQTIRVVLNKPFQTN